MKPKIIVHGGAWDIPPQFHDAHIAGVEKAAKVGALALNEGKTALEACISAVKVMEDDPTFDAGVGAFLNDKGEVELDAIVMNGSDLTIGSVAAVQNIRNPIELANLVRLKTEHCMLVGKGACEFAFREGMEKVDTSELLVGRERERYEELLKTGVVKARRFFDKPEKMGTVGAVAIDGAGNIACATSTGGTPNKLCGRVGDSPLVGAGAYANSKGGVSCTGFGESIMKVLLAKTVVDYIEFGLNGGEASERGVEKLGRDVNGLGGVICIDEEGRAGYSYNTPFMARAVADGGGLVESGI